MTNKENDVNVAEKSKYFEIDFANMPHNFVAFVKEAFFDVFGIVKYNICPKCGKKLPDEANFCIYCGQKIEKKEETNKNVNSKPVRIPKLATVIVLGAIALIIVVAVSLSSLGVFKKGVNVLTDDYITFVGSEGYGTAVINKSLQDESEFMELLVAEYNSSNADQEKINAYVTVLENYSCVIESENNGHLKNGDKVKVKCGYAENSKKMVDDALDKLDIKLKNTEREYTVSDLGQVPVVDFFEGVEVGWKHNNGYMDLKLDINNEYRNQGLPYGYEYDDSTGDVRIFVDQTADSIIEQFNAIGDLEKTYHVGKQPELITSLSDDSLKEKAKEIAFEGYMKASDACGWNIQPAVGNLQYDLIQDAQINSIKEGKTMVAELTVKCEHNNYSKTIKFNMFRNEDGSITYSFVDDLDGCEAKGSEWKNNR